ncbi:hypothetical protein BD414DRAFT_407127 [Trametes punicea]|nr:hypothetical protein BD414DRAFT_407127 [Trametes punicea]
MHLIWENVAKNLIQLWTGQYKALDPGKENYEIHPTVWEAIGEASTASGDTIPGVFGPRPPNVASDKLSWTADTRSFWIQYVGPVLLANRFTRRKYYTHFVLLVRLIRKCLQFEISYQDITQIREGFIAWVREYEEIYYQHNPERLSGCPLTIHALLHIADSIEMTGPVWTSWAFPMERYCGSLQPAIRNRRFPYSSINRYVLDRARLTHIKLIYQLDNHLWLRPPPSESGTSIAGYDTCVLLPPRRTRTLDKGLADKILACLCTRFNTPPPHLRHCIPMTVEEWGKLRILNAGDTIRTSSMNVRGEDSRDMTFVRYELLVDKNARFRNRPVVLEGRTFFGQLQHIISFPFLSRPADLSAAPDNLLLGVIQQCVIEERNEDLDIHYYSKMGGVEVVDLTTIQCLVGRIRDRHRWAIIDRSGSLSRALYVDVDHTL